MDSKYAQTRARFSLVRRGRKEVARAPVPASIVLEQWNLAECSDSRISAATKAFNDSFIDHISFAPERVERFLNMRDCNEDPHVFTVAKDKDRIAGLALSEYSRTYNAEKGLNVGWVVILGVLPEYRKRGLGKVLLADSMSWILKEGADTVYLGVFAKNEKALSLYASFGFEKERESIVYERQLKA